LFSVISDDFEELKQHPRRTVAVGVLGGSRPKFTRYCL